MPNYCVAKAGPGILTGMPPASWQVALLAHLCDSHTGAPMLKILGGIFFFGSEISWNHQTRKHR